MKMRKIARQHGKLSLSRYFQEFKEGDRVSVITEHSQTKSFPKRIHGLTGTIIGTRGNAYLVNVREGKMDRMHIIMPIHLKKLK